MAPEMCLVDSRARRPYASLFLARETETVWVVEEEVERTHGGGSRYYQP